MPPIQTTLDTKRALSSSINECEFCRQCPPKFSIVRKVHRSRWPVRTPSSRNLLQQRRLSIPLPLPTHDQIHLRVSLVPRSIYYFSVRPFKGWPLGIVVNSSPRSGSVGIASNPLMSLENATQNTHVAIVTSATTRCCIKHPTQVSPHPILQSNNPTRP